MFDSSIDAIGIAQISPQISGAIFFREVLSIKRNTLVVFDRICKLALKEIGHATIAIPVGCLSQIERFRENINCLINAASVQQRNSEITIPEWINRILCYDFAPIAFGFLVSTVSKVECA